MLNVLTLGYAHIMSMQNTESDVIVNVTSAPGCSNSAGRIVYCG